MKIDNITKLEELCNNSQVLLDSRLNKNSVQRMLVICGGTGCQSAKSREVLDALNTKIKEHGLQDQVKAQIAGCFGFCAEGPIMHVFPDDIFYVKVGLDNVDKIVEQHLLNNTVVEELLFTEPTINEKVETMHEMSFYKKQRRIALRNCGYINPEYIEEYIANKGYQALGQVLTSNDPQGVIDIISASGLKGRGGGGFPTGFKWDATRKAEGDVKYVICNADEGDPGAFMDRSLLEGDPHSIIEAMAITGYAIGAKVGYVYIRAEYPLAIERLENAINQARELGLLGTNILGFDFSFDIEIRLGAGAFVCGEETALIASIEGERGMPRNKPPYPAQKGLWQKPTLINNVETFANVPIIILNGVDWFNETGCENSTGTKVFALGGKINNVGLVEIEMGTSLRELIYEIGGGIPDNKEFKAVQTGGPSGGCLTVDHLDTKINYENLIALGSMMGSGGMIVMDETTCMVDIARFFLEFTVEESCGKCTPCREGTKRMHEILTNISEGKAEMSDLDRLESLASTIKQTSLCGLGQTAPNPVISTMKYFYDEYVEHIQEKKCRAKSCKQLIKYEINDKCIGCTKCARNCPVSCIEGKVKELHVIDQDACIKCNTCLDACPVNAITVG